MIHVDEYTFFLVGSQAQPAVGRPPARRPGGHRCVPQAQVRKVLHRARSPCPAMLMAATWLLALLLAQPMMAQALPSGKGRPHILFVLWDDYGWAGAGYHRPTPTPEVQTPTMDSLVGAGLDFANSYVFYCCSPTRSAIQSGRNPIHVNVLNADPSTFNASDPVAGAAGVARNFTGMATKMAAAGYAVSHCPFRAVAALTRGSCALCCFLLVDSLCRQVVRGPTVVNFCHC